MATKRAALGFGFIPKESEHHFLVIIPRSQNSKVLIYECFSWQDCSSNDQLATTGHQLKVEIDKSKWKQLEEPIKQEFNRRLKKQNIAVGKWKTGQVTLERLFGKEAVLLAWGVEDVNSSVIPVAVKNWLGLAPEERWWLFTMTNASTGYAHDKRGWRKAIKYALSENPVESSRQKNLFEFMFEENLQRRTGK